MDYLSQRGRSNVTNIMTKIPRAILNGPERTSNPMNSINLAMAENWLIRPEILEMCKAAIADSLDAHHLSWPTGFWGDPALLRTLATFFNTYFHPAIPITPSHLTLAPGAAHCLDALLYNICDAGDGVLVPGPYWIGNDIFFRIRAAATPILVSVPSPLDPLSLALIPAIEAAYASATIPIKALVLSNPHNPLGRCYERKVLEECINFCHRQKIHLISDEVFALSTFQSTDIPEAPGFVSVLALDKMGLESEAMRVSVIWSTSKDLGCSGLKVGCTVTPTSSPILRNALALAAHMNISTLSTLVANMILSSPSLPDLLSLSCTRLSENYTLMTAFFKDVGVVYQPCNAGIFILARLSPKATEWEEEEQMVRKFEERGVLVGGGRGYHVQEMGWLRICFAVEKTVLLEAIERMKEILR